MILKVYIQKHLFHLPRNQDDLTNFIKEKFYKRKQLVKSAFPKLYRISHIESENVAYDKDVNIFLVNLYLLLLEDKEKLNQDTDISITLSNENIIAALSKEMNEDLTNVGIEDLETVIQRFINGDASREKANNDDAARNQANNETENESESESEPDVEFNINWVKQMDKRLRE